MALLDREFDPGISHPFYFIRKGLKEAIENNAHILKGRLLDFGCGSKPYQPLFKVDEYIGVDFENEGHPHDNEQIDLIYDGKKLPFPDNYFDSILCSEVVEHVFNLEEILAELNRVLKKRGSILLTCPFTWNEHEMPFDFARYTQFALNDRLAKAGFSEISISKSGNFVTAISQLWVLYFYTILHKKPIRFFLFRWGYKLVFVLVPNLFGILLNKLFPSNTSYYLNNIVVARK